MIRRKFRNAGLLDDEYSTDGTQISSEQELTEAESVDDIVLVTSEVAESMMIFSKDGSGFQSTDEYKYHAPVLDLDFPAALVPSSTPGHFHLYLDTLVPHEKYMELLDALAEAGIIQRGYADASQDRGFTGVRAPWVTK